MVVADVEDRENVGMVQRRRRPGFLREALQAVLIGCEGSWQDLDGYGAVEARVVGAIDFAHSTGTDGRQNFIRAETSSSGERHKECMILT